MEIGAGELDDVYLDALDRQPVEQGSDEVLRVLVHVERAVDQVDPDDAQRLLLLDVLLIEQPDVDDDLVGFGARVRLEADAQPAMAFGGFVVALGSDGVGESEETRPARALVGEALLEQLVLVFEHLVEPLAADVARRRPVDGVGKRHVVGGDRLGDGARRPADVEEPPGHLLACADLGERAVFGGVQIDLERLLIHQVVAVHQGQS